jgi:hypothetical protein
VSWPITRDIVSGVRELFPVGRDRRVVLGLVVLAAIVSFTELAATKLFASLILPTSDRSGGTTAVLVAAFLLLYGGLRVINFGREMYRINVFERALTDSVGLSKVSDSWRWAMAMEVTQILTATGRLAVVTLAALVLAPVFGAAVVVVVALVGIWVSVLYRRHGERQREFRLAQLAYNPVDNATKVRTRIRAGETASLVGYFGIVILIALLLFLVLEEQINPGTGFVLFIALRMLGQTLTEVAKGLMRYARARAFSEVPGRADDEDDD